MSKKHIIDAMKYLYNKNYISIRDGNISYKPKNEKYFYISAGGVKKNEMNEQKICLMDMNSEAVISLGRFQNNINYKKDWRCDIHCRWSPSSKIIGFNSTHNGTRQVYIFKLDQ